MKVTVARIGRAQGLKGDVSLDVRTDIPQERLVRGQVYETEPASAGPLTIERVRSQGGRWYVSFAEVVGREAAEAARGVELVLESDEDDEDEAWFVHELVGLQVQRPDGEVLGKVVDLLTMPAHDVLVIQQAGGFRAMIPFVEEFVPEVDVDAGSVVVTPPYGLLAGETPEQTEETSA